LCLWNFSCHEGWTQAEHRLRIAESVDSSTKELSVVSSRVWRIMAELPRQYAVHQCEMGRPPFRRK
jgi:hypothetical protein